MQYGNIFITLLAAWWTLLLASGGYPIGAIFVVVMWCIFIASPDSK